MYGKRVVIRAVVLQTGSATSGSPQSALWLDVCLLVSYRPLAQPNRHGGEAFGVRTTWGWVQ